MLFLCGVMSCGLQFSAMAAVIIGGPIMVNVSSNIKDFFATYIGFAYF